MPMNVTILPPKGRRKQRRQESNHLVVRWCDEGGDTVYHRWFKRDSAAVAFINKLEDAGCKARLLMK